MTSKVINHWGKWINSDIPVTGVISNNAIVQFIADEISTNGIDLSWEEFIKSDEYDPEEEYDFFESGDWLIGDWLQDEDGKYYPNPEGEYSAIVREDVTQVVYSKYTKRGNVCSPCYPGQIDLDSKGDFLAYDIPPEGYNY